MIYTIPGRPGKTYMTADTTTKTLRQLLDEASSSISIYKNPNIDEAQERLNEVLEAAGLGSTGRDHIAAIDECIGMGGYFEIRTEWSARCCAQTSEYRLPTSIVDAQDPVQAARSWKHTKALREAEAEVKRCMDALDRARSRLEDLQKEAAS